MSEVKVTEEEQKQVGTQLKLTETQKISLFREHYGRFQHEYTNLRVMREENHDSTCIEYSVQKSEPDGSLSQNRENKALVENESGSNLYKENDPIQDENKSKIQEHPTNSELQGETEEKNKDTPSNDKNDASPYLVYRKVLFDSPIVNPDPEKYKIGTYFALTKQEAKELAAYNFSEDVSFEEFKANTEGVHEVYPRNR